MDEIPPAPLPSAWGVVYAKPNPDHTPKRCENCISADEPVLVEGVPRNIGRVHPGASVLTRSGWNRTNGLKASGLREVVEVISTAGLSIKVTPDHRFHTDDGWVRAIDLKPRAGKKKGHTLTTLVEAPSFKRDVMDRREAELRGALCGDGWITRHDNEQTIGFGFAGRMACAWGPLLKYAAERFESGERPYKRNGMDFYTLTWRNKRAKEFTRGFSRSSIPDDIWRSTPECAGAFLRGLFSTDGSIGSAIDPRWNSHTVNVTLCNTDKKLIDSVRLLLRSLGIPSSLTVYTRAPSYKDLYVVAISRKDALERFAQIAGFVDERRMAILRDGLSRKKRAPFVERVKSVSPAGMAKVVDISVPSVNSFFAAGFLVHNCVMWSWNDQKCSIHPKSLHVPPFGVCGYHVFGVPMETRMEHPGMDPVDPALSGFDTNVGPGTFCGSCIYYEPTSEDKGACWAVAGKDQIPPHPVDLMGCCARWEGRF